MPGVYICITLKIIFFPPPLSEIIFFPPYLYLQECKNKHIFDHFVPVFEQVVFINFHFLSLSALSAIFPPPPNIFFVVACIVFLSTWFPKNPRSSLCGLSL